VEGIVRSTDGRTWSFIPNSNGRFVGFAAGDGRLFAADQWSTSYVTASDRDPTHWTRIPPPADLPADQGAPYLDYDTAHHILYSSNYAAGLWRVVLAP
jgi:hypothetical protein